MELDLTAEQWRFRDELRSYLARLMTDALVRELASGGEGGGPELRRAMQQMGRDGLLGVSWPRQYGGQERSAIEQFRFADEVQAAGFPLPFLTLNTERRARASALPARRMSAISVLTALSLVDELDTHLRGALHHGVTPAEIEEVMLMAVVYAGFPRAIFGLARARQAFAATGGG